VTVQELLDIVHEYAPPHYAFGFDRIGLQVGNPGAVVERVAVSLDSGLGAIRFAKSVGASAIVCHHPVIWEPIKQLRADEWNQRRVLELAQSGISLIAAHTNWDCAPGGINDALAACLGLTDVVAFGSAEVEKRWKLVVFVPLAQRDAVIDACARAGAGTIGNYDRCAFLSEGVGTFEPGAAANPVIGQPGVRTEVAEARVEMVVAECHRAGVERALREVHPYEEPAFDWVTLREGTAHPAGRIGTWAGGEDFQVFVDGALGSRSDMWVGHERPIRRVAVVGGAASGEWKSALKLGADAFVTGEIPQHVALEASETGLTVLACGHYATEQPGMASMADRLRDQVTVPVDLYEPEPGFFGRPR
jgi:dinuclear metal center YbgI/SA1388 family protein